MRWRYAGTGTVALLMTGCPHDYGKDGRADKEVHKAEVELVRKYCDKEMLERYCGGDRKNTPECRRQCG